MPEIINVIIAGSVVTIIFVIMCSIFIRRRQNKKLAKTFTIWLFFTVMIALIPIAFNVVAIIFRESQRPALLPVLAKGELLIVSVAVGSDAIGRYFASETNEMSEIIAASLCFILVIISVFVFPIFSIIQITIPIYHEQLLNLLSSIAALIFFTAIFFSGTCVLMTEMTEIEAHPSGQSTTAGQQAIIISGIGDQPKKIEELTEDELKNLLNIIESASGNADEPSKVDNQ